MVVTALVAEGLLVRRRLSYELCQPKEWSLEAAKQLIDSYTAYPRLQLYRLVKQAQTGEVGLIKWE
jgi:hypothetical protein